MIIEICTKMMILIISASCSNFRSCRQYCVIGYDITRLLTVIRNCTAVNYFLTSTKNWQEGKLLKMVTHELLVIEKALVLDIDNHIILPFVMCCKTLCCFALQ